MKRILLVLAILVLAWQLTGCFENVDQPDPQPKSPPPTQQVNEEAPEG